MAGRAAGAGTGNPRAVLAQLWRVHRPTNVERVELLERVTADLLAGRVDAEAREDARSAAHKLAGSLGTFGFNDGTAAARDAERELERTDTDLRVLAEAVQRLRETLDHAIVADVADVDDRDEVADVAEHEQRRPAPTTRDAADVREAAATTPASARARLAVVTSDRELATALSVEAAAGGLAVEVCDPTEAWSLAVYDGSTQAIVLDMVDLLPAVVAERVAAGADPPPAIVVLGADDSVPARLAAATAGADAYVWRRTSPRRVVSFVSRIVRQRARDAADVVVLSPGSPTDRVWRLGGGDRHVRSVRVVPDLGMLAVHVGSDVPDVVVLDDGVTADDVRAVGRLLRGNPAWHFTPIVAVVPVDDVAARIDAFEAGADDVVRADIAPAELAERLAVAASRARRGRVAAELDPLTHIPNRDRAEAAIEHLLRRAEVNGTRATIALIDVDRLADVNARYGEAAGDLVLHEFGALLTQFFRDDDTVGRWGADEFVVGLAGVGTELASERLRALFERFEHQMGLGEHVEGITFSAGVAAYPDDGRRSTRLLNAAATRMRTAQARGDQIVGAGDERPGVVDVVVVEDDVVIADVVSTALRQRGLEVRVIPDGAAAADALGSGTVRARLVLLDIGLPGLDGFGVLQVLRERGVLRSTKVVVLTARSTETETLRALGLGAVDHIAKPFSLPILVRRIRSVLAG